MGCIKFEDYPKKLQQEIIILYVLAHAYKKNGANPDLINALRNKLVKESKDKWLETQQSIPKMEQ